MGCMFAKANARAFKLMVQVTEALSRAGGWDQQVCVCVLFQTASVLTHTNTHTNTHESGAKTEAGITAMIAQMCTQCTRDLS